MCRDPFYRTHYGNKRWNRGDPFQRNKSRFLLSGQSLVLAHFSSSMELDFFTWITYGLPIIQDWITWIIRFVDKLYSDFPKKWKLYEQNDSVPVWIPIENNI